MDSTDVPTSPPPPPAPTPAPGPATPIQSSAVSGGDQCANCGAPLALDQRYCLQCGQRRGDPRLPFMDAVVLMDAVQRPNHAPPPAPKKKRSGISPNAALITGIGVLLLALGLGVLIGRSGNNSSAPQAQAPQVITVPGSGGGSGTGTESTTPKANAHASGKGKTPKTSNEKTKALKELENHPASSGVLHPSKNAKPAAKATAKVGEKCEEGSAGCENGKFKGNFFGE